MTFFAIQYNETVKQLILTYWLSCWTMFALLDLLQMKSKCCLADSRNDY